MSPVRMVAYVVLVLSFGLAGCANWEKKPPNVPPTVITTASAVQIKELGNNVRSIHAGTSHNCALMQDRTVRCWGDNRFKQLGTEAHEESEPKEIKDPAEKDKALLFEEISVGNGVTCGKAENHKTYCLGKNNLGQIGIDPKDPTTKKITNTKVSIATVINFDFPVHALFSKFDRQCVIGEDLIPYCWGHIVDIHEKPAPDGRTSTFPPTDETTHTPKALNQTSRSAREGSVDRFSTWTNIKAITATAQDICVIGDDGLSCIRSNWALAGLSAMTAGRNHLCALMDGLKEVRCVGENARGQVGEGAGENYDNKVVKVTGLPDVRIKKISAGNDHTCALTEHAGEVWCWGFNTQGQLGDPGVEVKSRKPLKVRGIGKAIDVSAGGDHTCAVLADQTVSCWGESGYSLLGAPKT